MQEGVAIIIPCFNEENRLQLADFEQYATKYYILFVNDGSSDGTQTLLDEAENKRMYQLHLPQNVGKAEAVRMGMLHLRTLPFFEDLKWFGFMDADLATPLSEVELFFRFNQNFRNNRADVILGSRVGLLGAKVERSFSRHILGRLFSTVSDTLFKIGCYDTQCGAKFFKINYLEQIASKEFISKWIFDIEILMRLKQENAVVIEYPVSTWCDVAGSKLKVHKVVWRVLLDFAAIKRAYRDGS
ncbi:MAG: dolichyl-phosphate beta-glucosyltransferase [Bacteroidia bacterium]|jgi:dolichyl-phosphate beta-glucosyltransferase